MPNCFQLYPKGSTQPAILQNVDAAMCQHFNAPVDPKYWFRDWFHVIGFLIAMGRGSLGSPSLREAVIAWYADDYGTPTPEALTARERMIAVLDWLERHYTSDAFVEIGRRI
jgi:hypothetical protein